MPNFSAALPLDSPLHDRFDFRVAAHACDPQKRLSIPSLIRELQETALASTLRLGVSVYDLEPLGLGWVLLGQRLHLHRMPSMNERCQVVTCPVGFERVFTFRDFHLLDQQANCLATATTTWMLMNLDSRRMAPLPDFVKALDAHTPPAEQQLPRATYQLLLPETAPLANKSFTVGYHHLDTNGHLTNAFYAQWMLEGLAYDFLHSRQLTALDIQFKREARYGDVLRISLEKSADNSFQHALFLDTEVLATMQTSWNL